MTTDISTAIIIPNFNGENYVHKAIDSLLQQSYPCQIIVVENGSSDNSLAALKKYGTKITILINKKNLGFAGGVNVGIRYALKNNFEAIALFNNDARADKDWLRCLVKTLSEHPTTGIVACCMLLGDGNHIDSTGEFYTTWGLPYPRDRDEATSVRSSSGYVFGASGGASLYRSILFEQIGLFDETFFAYYEDTDISFRAQLAGWKIQYTSEAVVYHQQGKTSETMASGFTTMQTMKNLPMLFIKNTPSGLLLPIGIRFCLAYILIFCKALLSTYRVAAIKGLLLSFRYLPHSITERHKIQKIKAVSHSYIYSVIIRDLPPNQTGLRKLRSLFIHK